MKQLVRGWHQYAREGVHVGSGHRGSMCVTCHATSLVRNREYTQPAPPAPSSPASISPLPLTSHIVRFSADDPPNETRFILEEGAGGNTDVEAMIVFDGVTNAIVSDESPVSSSPARYIFSFTLVFSSVSGVASRSIVLVLPRD